MWYHSNNAPVNGYVFTFRNSNAGTEFVISNQGRRLRLWIRASNFAEGWTLTEVATPIDEWFHFAISYESNSKSYLYSYLILIFKNVSITEVIKFYMNGIWIGSKSSNIPSLQMNSMEEFHLGTNGNGGNFGDCGDCYVTDVEFYKRVLSSQEIAQIHSK